MKLLANENLSADLVAALRSRGHDVAWIREANPGLADPAVLSWATREARILITFDKDFGELAFRAGLPAECGVILLRVAPPRSEEEATALARAISSRSDWKGCFSVVRGGRVRMRPLPGEQP